MIGIGMPYDVISFLYDDRFNVKLFDNSDVFYSLLQPIIS